MTAAAIWSPLKTGSPPAELEVRRDHHRLGLIGVCEDLEDQTGAVGVQRQEPELVDDGRALPIVFSQA